MPPVPDAGLHQQRSDPRISDSSRSYSYFLREKDAYECARASPRCSLPAETQLTTFHQTFCFRTAGLVVPFLYSLNLFQPCLDWLFLLTCLLILYYILHFCQTLFLSSVISSAQTRNLYFFVCAPGLSGFCGAGRRIVHLFVIVLEFPPIRVTIKQQQHY